jgi:hypothetical protein
MEEELSTLFQRQMALAYGLQATSGSAAPAALPAEPRINYCASQHYHHSAHVVRRAPAKAVQAQSPHATEAGEAAAIAMLTQHGIDPAVLSTSQLTLFVQADMEQKLRLVELWRLFPESLRQQSYQPGFQQQQQQQQPAQHMRMICAAEAQPSAEHAIMAASNGSYTPQQETVDSMANGAHAEAEQSARSDPQPGQRDEFLPSASAEPYMASGYEELARREYLQQLQARRETYSPLGAAVGNAHLYKQATDPAYQGPGDWGAAAGAHKLLAATQARMPRAASEPPQHSSPDSDTEML